MTLSAFLWDLDGTLVDTERLWAKAISAWLGTFGCDASADELIRIVFGRSWRDIFLDLLAKYPRIAGQSIEQVSKDLRPFYETARGDPRNMIIAPSVACLKQVAKIGPCAIVSGSMRADVEDAVKLIGCEKEISFVLGAEDYPRGKPAPDGYALAAQRLGIPPSQCVVFEDSPAGVLSAKSAGCLCVGFDPSGKFAPQLSSADWIVPDLSRFTPQAFAEHIAAQCQVPS